MRREHTRFSHTTTGVETLRAYSGFGAS